MANIENSISMTLLSKNASAGLGVCAACFGSGHYGERRAVGFAGAARGRPGELAAGRKDGQPRPRSSYR